MVRTDDEVLTLAKIKSTSVVVNFLSSRLQSLATLASVLPSISLPAVKPLKTLFKSYPDASI
jgi:hypothetical protein